MTFYQVSQRSERKYGRSSLYFLPHNLYSDLRGGTFSPSIYQFLALSRIAGYRLPGWVRVFGADLENIADILPSRRSILLDSWLTNPYVPGFHGSETESGTALPPPVAPLDQLLQLSGPKRLSSLSESKGRGYRRRGPALTFRLANKGPGACPVSN